MLCSSTGVHRQSANLSPGVYTPGELAPAPALLPVASLRGGERSRLLKRPGDRQPVKSSTIAADLVENERWIAARQIGRSCCNRWFAPLSAGAISRGT